MDVLPLFARTALPEDLGRSSRFPSYSLSPARLRGFKCWHYTGKYIGVGRGFYLCPKFSIELNITSTNPLHTQHNQSLSHGFILITVPTSELQITRTNLPFCGQRSTDFQGHDQDCRALHNPHPLERILPNPGFLRSERHFPEILAHKFRFLSRDVKHSGNKTVKQRQFKQSLLVN